MTDPHTKPVRGMKRWELINRLLAERPGPTTYLEIGVSTGTSLRQVQADTRLGVDPHFRSRKMRLLSRLSPGRIRLGARRGLLPLSMTSDRFFDRYAPFLDAHPIDVAFIDGLHTADQAHRDIVHALEHLQPDGTVVVHDCNPQSPTAADPAPQDGIWNGDVFKAIIRLRVERDDLHVVVLDADEGLGIVRFGTPECPIDLDWEHVGAMSYEDFAGDRQRLLNLRPVTALADLLPDVP